MELDEVRLWLEMERALQRARPDIESAKVRIDMVERALRRAEPELRRWLRVGREEIERVNPLSQAVVSLAKVPIRGVATARQVATSMAKIVPRLLEVIV